MNLIGTVTKMPFMIREIFISEWTLSLSTAQSQLVLDFLEAFTFLLTRFLYKSYKSVIYLTDYSLPYPEATFLWENVWYFNSEIA